MFRNILVSVDGSPHSLQALAEAIDVTTTNRARLTILTAVPKPPGWICLPMSACASEELRADFEHESSEILDRAVDAVPKDVPVTKILTHEPIRDALLHRTESGDYDLLVMGSRGRGALTASLLGSVSHHVLNHCKIPVLIVHDESEPQDHRSARERPARESPSGQIAISPS
jgi:nucleotide-binding universal stress UspA family protein